MFEMAVLLHTQIQIIFLNSLFTLSILLAFFDLWNRGDVVYEAFHMTPDIKIQGGQIRASRRHGLSSPLSIYLLGQ